MIALGRSRFGAGRRQQRAQTRIAPVAHDLQTKAGQGAIEAREAGHVADGAQGRQIQPLTNVRLGPLGE